MANLNIIYTQEGELAISNQDDIKLTGMSVSADGSSWIACTDCYWTGNLFCGTVTATEDDFALNEVKVFFTNDSTVLCSGSGGPIATLINGQSLEISFNPRIECKELITNTPSGGGGGGGEIDPAILDAKQDKAVTVTNIRNQSVSSTVENLLNHTVSTDSSIEFAPVWHHYFNTNDEETEDYHYKVAERAYPSLVRLRIHGYIGEAYNTQVSYLDITILLSSTSATMQGFYDRNLYEGCDIKAKAGEVWLELHGINRFADLVFEGYPTQQYTISHAEPADITARMSTDCTNLSAGGGGGGSRMTLIDPNSTISAEPISVDTNGGNT